ncbi:hypothetical protein HMPREF2943_02990 [Corynebacterium sp. HMSC072D12]|uniref:hypothetical protein n=1 Tax=Corynebacterium sp. HMSC072D12 TaxID=1739447 RepID=UPI0008A4A284|nr:hypothetical protein [Corynebacterium sp. HMSC072D12]OFQ33994.1 hypothetical protein HMPREF2943_02990 [Corynebacterium sp. HMSC072D12]
MTTLTITVYGIALVFTIICVMILKQTVCQLQEVVSDLDRDLTVVEVVLEEREKRAVEDSMSARWLDPFGDVEMGIGGAGVD